MVAERLRDHRGRAQRTAGRSRTRRPFGSRARDPSPARRTRAEADYDVRDLLPAALDELGLTFYPVGGEAGQPAAVRALARRLLAGELTPREFSFRIHQRHGHELPLTAAEQTSFSLNPPRSAGPCLGTPRTGGAGAHVG